MTTDFSTTIVVKQSPEQAFQAINNPRAWWSEEIVGNTDKLNSAFDYHYEEVHRCKMRITEFIPRKKVVWQVEENYFNFTKDQSEWIGTHIVFEISGKGDATQILFTHEGLVPQHECYDICRDAWTTYITVSLHDLIVTGKGAPNAKGTPRTANEERLGSSNK